MPSSETLGRVAASAAALIVGLDREGRINFANPYCCQITGYGEDELLGRPLGDLLPEGLGADVLDGLRAPEPDGLPREFEAPLATKDGELRAVIWRTAFTADADGEIRQVFAMGADVTGQRLAEGRLARLNAVLRRINAVTRLLLTRVEGPELLDRVCAHLTGTRRCKLAWVALVGEDGRFTRTFGPRDNEHFLRLEAAAARGDAPPCVAKALRTGGLAVTHAGVAECAGCPMAAALEHTDVMALRLEHGGRAYGVFSVHVPEEVAGDAYERHLFRQVAADIVLELHRAEAEAAYRRTQEELGEQSRILESFFSHTLMPVGLLDPHFNYVRVNPAFIRALHRGPVPPDPLEWVGRNHFDLHPPRPGAVELFQAAVDTKQPQRAEGRAYVFPGHPEWGTTYWDWTLVPILDEAGEVALLSFCLHDRTSQKRLELALAEQLRVLDAFFEHTVTPIALLDKDFNFIRVNQAYGEQDGRDVSEFPGHNHFEFYPSDAEAIFREVVETGRPYRTYARPFVYAYHPERGTTYWNWTLVPLRNEEGDVELLVFSLEDVTERKRAELALLEHRARLQALTSELSLAEERERRRLAGDLHDNLGHILTFVKMRLGELSDAELPSHLNAAVEEIEGLVDDAVDYTDTLTSRLSPTILYDLGLEAAVEWLADQSQQQHGFAVEVADDGRPKPLAGDVAVTLFQALRELIMNVGKHAHARTVRISLLTRDDSLRVDVQDDGVGFDPSQLQAPRQAGAEFGLFNIRERLRYLGGRLDIQSQPGHGARIMLTVPLSPEEQPIEA